MIEPKIAVRYNHLITFVVHRVQEKSFVYYSSILVGQTSVGEVVTRIRVEGTNIISFAAAAAEKKDIPKKANFVSKKLFDTGGKKTDWKRNRQNRTREN